MRTFPHVMGQNIVPAASDRVVTGIPIPGGSTLKHVWYDFSLTATAAISFREAVMYGISAYIVPVLDPDDPGTPDAMWDTQIPKDEALDTTPDVIDMDSSTTVDPTPEIEPGDPSLEELFNVGSRPERIFQKTQLITFGKQSAGFEVGTPDTFIPRDAFKGEIKQNYFVQMPSMLLFGVSAPATTGTDTAIFVPSTNEEWMQLKFMADTAKDAWKHAVGLIETGAETPYVDAGILLNNYLERFFELTADSYVSASYDVYSDMRFEIEVEGELSIESISAGA